MPETKPNKAGSGVDQIDYLGILKSAFNMVRHHRYLWYLGILAGGGSNVGFNGGVNFGDFFQQKEENSVSAASVAEKASNTPDQWLDEILRWVQDNLIFVMAIALVVFLIIIIFALLSNMAKAGLIYSVDCLSKNEESSFMAGMKFGWHKFWRVFGSGILLGLVSLAVITALAVPVVLAWFVNIFLGIFLTFLALPILFFVMILIGVIFEYTLRYISLKDGKIIASIKSGYELLKSRKKETLFIWLITLGISIVCGMVIVFAMIFVAIILFLLGLLLYLLAPIAGIIYAVIAVAAFIAAILVAGGFVSSFLSSYWTLCFKEIEAV